MTCCKNKNAEKKPVDLIFHVSELLYDIKNVAYVEGDIMVTDDDHQRHQVQDIGEDGNIDRVKRMLDLAYAECLEICYPYSKVDVCNYTQACDALQDRDEYVMHLNVPSDFSQTTINLLVQGIHDYMVSRVLYDWMRITNANAAAHWKEQMELQNGSIQGTLNARTRRVRRTLNPF